MFDASHADAGTIDQLHQAIGALDPRGGYVYVEHGYQVSNAEKVVLWILFGLAGVLMLGGTLTATFLALSDARPDLATLSAVGASPRMRRAVAAAYAVAVGFVGAVLGAAVGFVPGHRGLVSAHAAVQRRRPRPVALPRDPVAGDRRARRAAAAGHGAGGGAPWRVHVCPWSPASTDAESAQSDVEITPSRRKVTSKSRRVVL